MRYGNNHEHAARIIIAQASAQETRHTPINHNGSSRRNEFTGVVVRSGEEFNAIQPGVRGMYGRR
jgi:hypothetical protein